MPRVVREWKPIMVDDLDVAPHRYRYTGTIGPDGQELKDVGLCDEYREAMQNVPYREGEVVFVEGPKGKPERALIHTVYLRRDRFGFRVERYKIQRQTAKGLFSKLWEQSAPGFIQRGYQQAGLAPEMPDEQEAA